MKTKAAFVVDHDKSRRAGLGARVLAVLLLVVIVTWALFGKAFRFGENCTITVGQQAPSGQMYQLCNWLPPDSVQNTRR